MHSQPFEISTLPALAASALDAIVPAESSVPVPSRSEFDSLLERLNELAQFDQTVFIGFWLAFGSELTRPEIELLEWPHIIERDGGTWACGPIGLRGQPIEVFLQPRAAAAIAPLRSKQGRVLGPKSSTWQARLCYFLRRVGTSCTWLNFRQVFYRGLFLWRFPRFEFAS